MLKFLRIALFAGLLLGLFALAWSASPSISAKSSQPQVTSEILVPAVSNVDPKYNEGYQKGYNEGYSLGYKDCVANAQKGGQPPKKAFINDPYTNGYNAGFAAGYNKGYSACPKQNNQAKYQEGYRKGYSEGYRTGFQDCVASKKTPEKKFFTTPNDPYTKGYIDGFAAGYNKGFYACPKKPAA